MDASTKDWGDGAGALWATVTSIRKNHHMEWTGRIGMDGAVIGVVIYALEPIGKGTLLKLSHRAADEVTPETETNYHGGWQDLLGTRLRAFVERGERPGLRKGPGRKAVHYARAELRPFRVSPLRGPDTPA